ncbi:hypothetical protein EM308_14085 [Flavobacterium gilvum]|uniref:Uncharacterized protein n=1 Tax=Flavobacterium gilvum TaxID=1492737 RepID=A0AAC9I471_9FLAO|nr:hypothetical protein EM308_14085 [Flavobacterium gilvum]
MSLQLEEKKVVSKEEPMIQKTKSVIFTFRIDRSIFKETIILRKEIKRLEQEHVNQLWKNQKKLKPPELHKTPLKIILARFFFSKLNHLLFFYKIFRRFPFKNIIIFCRKII